VRHDLRVNKRTVDMAVPVVYVLAIIVAAVSWDSGVIWVAIVGALIVGAYFAFLRNTLFGPPNP
jgi:hypothetical protein